MRENLQLVLVAIVGTMLVVSALLTIASYIVSRFVFNGYLKKNYRKKWEELVYDNEGYKGLNLTRFDQTLAMFKFRYKSDEDFGDVRLSKLRKMSINLFRAGILTWFTLIVGALFFAVIAKYEHFL